MAHFHYHAAAVPMRYPDRVQQESTLFPLMGWPKKPLRSPKLTMDARKTQIIAKAYSLQKLWRERVETLGEDGWAVARATPQGLRDRAGAQRCRPTFFIPSGATGFRANNAPGQETFRVCNRVPICPFCYARWVREMWLRVDYTLFRDPEGPGRAVTEQTIQALQAAGPPTRRRGLTISDRDPDDPLDTEEPADPIMPRNTGVDLLWWREQQLVTPGVVDGPVAGPSAIQQALANLVRWEWPTMMKHREPQKYHMVLGGLQSIVVEPYTLGENRKFVVTIRRLMITPHGSITDNRQQTIAKKVTAEIKTIEQPSRKIVVAEMAKLLRYPTGLLRGDVPLTVSSLHASRLPNGRGGRANSMKLNSTTGCLWAAARKMREAGIS